MIWVGREEPLPERGIVVVVASCFLSAPCSTGLAAMKPIVSAAVTALVVPPRQVQLVRHRLHPAAAQHRVNGGSVASP